MHARLLWTRYPNPTLEMPAQNDTTAITPAHKQQSLVHTDVWHAVPVLLATATAHTSAGSSTHSPSTTQTPQCPCELELLLLRLSPGYGNDGPKPEPWPQQLKPERPSPSGELPAHKTDAYAPQAMAWTGYNTCMRRLGMSEAMLSKLDQGISHSQTTSAKQTTPDEMTLGQTLVNPLVNLVKHIRMQLRCCHRQCSYKTPQPELHKQCSITANTYHPFSATGHAG
jgi:hypothetical protein